MMDFFLPMRGISLKALTFKGGPWSILYRLAENQTASALAKFNETAIYPWSMLCAGQTLLYAKNLSYFLAINLGFLQVFCIDTCFGLSTIAANKHKAQSFCFQ